MYGVCGSSLQLLWKNICWTLEGDPRTYVGHWKGIPEHVGHWKGIPEHMLDTGRGSQFMQQKSLYLTRSITQCCALNMAWTTNLFMPQTTGSGMSTIWQNALLVFWQWLLHQYAILTTLLVTDMCNFTRVIIMNFYNLAYVGNHIPHMIGPGHYQHRFSTNVWIGIIRKHPIGPHKLPAEFSGAWYLWFLCRHLPLLLEDLSLCTW
jgi:hypothetical protein